MINLRKMKSSDATGVATIQVECWRKAYAGIIPDKYLASLDVNAKAKTWETGLSVNPDVIRIVALEKNIPFGFVAGLENRSSAFYPEIASEAWSIYVHPDHWKKGIGKSLLLAFIEEMRKLKHSTMIVWALEENLPARAFYESMGGVLQSQKQTQTYGGKSLSEVAYSFKI